jgi:glycosyltransferase involved in cell wall biosynthesis
MTPSIRILHVIPSVSMRDGGPSRAIGIMEHALSSAGVEVTTLTTDHGVEHCHGNGQPVTMNGVRRIYARKWLHPYKVAPGLLRHLLRLVEAHDVVHIHGLFSFSTTVAAWAARRAGVPYVVRPLGSLARYGLRERRPRLKWLSMAMVEGQILRGAAAVHFTSRAEMEEASATGVPMSGVVIPLGVCTENGLPALPLQHAALADRRVILFLARLDPMKNLEAVIDAMAGSPTLRASCALVIAGTGEPRYVASLKARAAAAGLSERTLWLGHVEGLQKRAAFAAADVFVLPSFMENFGIAAVEALLAGVPCLLGEDVAIAREVERAGAGVVVSPQPAAVMQALESILRSSDRLEMARRARRFAEREFSVEVMTERLVALYESIRAPRARRTAGTSVQ